MTCTLVLIPSADEQEMMLDLSTDITSTLERHHITFAEKHHPTRLYNLQMHVLMEVVTIFWGDDTDDMLEYMQMFLNNYNERHAIEQKGQDGQ